MDTFGVVSLDALMYCLVEFCDGVEDFTVVHLGLQVSEEIVCDRVVVAVGFT